MKTFLKIKHRVIAELEGKEPDRETIRLYTDSDGEKYRQMSENIRERFHFPGIPPPGRYARIHRRTERKSLSLLLDRGRIIFHRS